MLSSFGERCPLARENPRAGTTAAAPGHRAVVDAHALDRQASAPPSHPAASTEVGQLLDLGLALGHQHFELVSLAGRDDAAMVAAHAWAEARDSSERDCNSTGTDTRWHESRAFAESVRTRRPRPPGGHAFEFEAGRDKLCKEVEWLRERVDNLSHELVLARRDTSRLTQQLKQEEGLGREQRRRADDAAREARALREELDRLKEARTASSVASRAALSDAHDRSVRMAERRRRQQAESLMQAYKRLYEDQLQAQHASAESHRPVTRGIVRRLADSSSVEQETAVTTAGTSEALSVFVDRQAGADSYRAAATTREAPGNDGGIEAAPESGRPASAPAATPLPINGAIGDNDDGADRSTAAESAAAVAAAAGALAVVAASTDGAEEPAPNKGATECAKDLGRGGKSRTSPTDCVSTPDTLACSPYFGSETVAMAAPEKREAVDVTAPAGGNPTSYSSTADAVAVLYVPSTGSARGDARSCGSAERYAFPPSGDNSAPPRRVTRSGGSGESSRYHVVGEVAPAVVAVPPAEPAPRWRGRSAGPRRGYAHASSWVEAVDAPKRSSSPTPPRRGRWEACGGGRCGWGDKVAGEDGCVRIEPSRSRPHSI